MMPWGWECRAKLVKQNKLKQTKRKSPISDEFYTPGPTHYTPPRVLGGKGYSKIRRAPAYSFGRMTPATFVKSPITAKAPALNIVGLTPKGPYKILHGVLTPIIEVPSDKTKIPGPNSYIPADFKYKRPPAYTMKPRAKPPFVPSDQWTPSPIMYKPPLSAYRTTAPSYSLGNPQKIMKTLNVPGPGEHDPKFDFIMKRKPAFSFGAPHRKIRQSPTPSATAYCEKRFNIVKPTIPAPSFGIKHSPYLGNMPEYRKESHLDLTIRSYDL